MLTMETLMRDDLYTFASFVYLYHPSDLPQTASRVLQMFGVCIFALFSLLFKVSQILALLHRATISCRLEARLFNGKLLERCVR